MKNFLFILFSLPFIAVSQTLNVQGTGANMYLTHKTGPKESFYSIGRIYNISPKVMAPFNNLELEKGLIIGQVVKIPLNEINFSQDGAVLPDEVLIPIHYKAKPKETLNNVSSVAGNVPVTSLKKWNKLTSDAVAGKNLVIGYLKVKKDLSPLASTAVKVEPLVGTTSTVPAVPANEPPVVAKQEPKPAEVKSEPVKTEVKTEPVKTVPVTQKPPVVTTSSNPVATSFNGGTFKNVFERQASTKEERGRAGTFKSTSGWQDGKYYCFHNTARAGSIIKITNPTNQKAIYAKVLDVIPDIKDNVGMIVRLSNAAGDELGITTETFDCIVNY